MIQRKYPHAKVVAEIGCNHKGSLDIAKELVRLAHQAGAVVAKFQKRCPTELLSPEQYNAPHPNPRNSYGPTYGAHREFLELDKAQHAELKAYCESLDILYSTSVWDVTSAREIVALEPALIKVPSAGNTHFEMLRILRDEFQGEVHMSFGMTTREEEARAVAFFEETGQAAQRLVIYACTSGYPVPAEDVCLVEIQRLKAAYGKRVKAVGFSGHHLGTAIDVAAYALGAHWIERHFTKDRAWKGTDHAASLEPADMARLVEDLGQVHLAMTCKSQELLDIEVPQRDKLKYAGRAKPEEADGGAGAESHEAHESVLSLSKAGLAS